jgi:molybdenum cofactor cytidylyltransferase
MGSPKQLLLLDGVSLVRRAADAVLGAGCEALWVVVGSHGAEVREALRGLEVQVVENPAWQDGLGGSIRVGVEAACRDGEPDGLLVTLADQPRVDSAVLARLMEAFDGAPESIVASAYPGAASEDRGPGVVGVPALFGRAHFDALRRLEGDRGARGLLERSRDRLTTVPCDEAAIDVDTPGDYAKLQAD